MILFLLEPHFDIDIRYTSTLLPILFHISGSRASDMVEHPVYTSRKYPYSRLQRKGNREMLNNGKKYPFKWWLLWTKKSKLKNQAPLWYPLSGFAYKKTCTLFHIGRLNQLSGYCLELANEISVKQYPIVFRIIYKPII